MSIVLSGLGASHPLPVFLPLCLRPCANLAQLLSYQNILKIDNLVGFDKLVKLQLDNNIIEKIENLGHLTSLEALDLSFNNIAEISGLESLKNLTTLSLFSNRITKLQGLDGLEQLKVRRRGVASRLCCCCCFSSGSPPRPELDAPLSAVAAGA